MGTQNYGRGTQGYANRIKIVHATHIEMFKMIQGIVSFLFKML